MQTDIRGSCPSVWFDRFRVRRFIHEPINPPPDMHYNNPHPSLRRASGKNRAHRIGARNGAPPSCPAGRFLRATSILPGCSGKAPPSLARRARARARAPGAVSEIHPKKERSPRLGTVPAMARFSLKHQEVVDQEVWYLFGYLFLEP